MQMPMMQQAASSKQRERGGSSETPCSRQQYNAMLSNNNRAALGHCLSRTPSSAFTLHAGQLLPLRCSEYRSSVLQPARLDGGLLLLLFHCCSLARLLPCDACWPARNSLAHTHRRRAAAATTRSTSMSTTRSASRSTTHTADDTQRLQLLPPWLGRS
jgi:hypothetical protein